jgi:hypothetical protein
VKTKLKAGYLGFAKLPAKKGHNIALAILGKDVRQAKYAVSIFPRSLASRQTLESVFALPTAVPMQKK